MENSICVLMSTYNGEKYVREQLDSIIDQSGPINLSILIRDDGSSDNTQVILDEYCNRYNNITWYSGKNLGPGQSFMDLIYHVSGYDYYAFADQDDYWFSEKMFEAIKQFNNDNKTPMLYFSSKIIVDKNLKPTGQQDLNIKHVDLGAALINKKASGCTMVFNDELLCLLKRYHQDLFMHDAWVYVLAAALGKVIYDKNSYILYRQHGDNTVGAEHSLLKLWKIRMVNFPKKRLEHYRSDYAKCLIAGYGDLLEDKDYDLIYDFAHVRDSIVARIRLCTSPRLKTIRWYEMFFVRIFILLGWV